jgi:hypothetical protein
MTRRFIGIVGLIGPFRGRVDCHRLSQLAHRDLPPDKGHETPSMTSAVGFGARASHGTPAFCHKVLASVFAVGEVPRRG